MLKKAIKCQCLRNKIVKNNILIINRISIYC